MIKARLALTGFKASETLLGIETEPVADKEDSIKDSKPLKPF